MTVKAAGKKTVDRPYALADDAKVTLYLDGKFTITTGKDALYKGLLKEGMGCSFRIERKRIVMMIATPAAKRE
jgi:hypothetical protein